MSFKAFYLTILVILLAFSCKKKKNAEFINSIQKIEDDSLSARAKELGDACRDPMNYVPDPDHLDHFPIKYIKVNFHIIRNNEGKGNFQEEEGRKYMKTTMHSAKENLRANKKMNLPVGNDTPVRPLRYSYTLTGDPSVPGDDGIYFHNDDDHYYINTKGKNRNNYDRSVFEKYGVQKGEVLNVFVQDIHLDSLKSKTFKASTNGIAFSTWIKGGYWYHAANYTKMDKGKKVYPKKWMPAKNLNHEIGHVFSLKHSWRRDGCEDTPNHENCWAPTGKPPCEVTSNNVMDYNPSRAAFTPCQIGNFLMTASRNPTKRNLLIKRWCKLKENKTIRINEDIEWNACKELEGHIIIEAGGKLTIRCKVALPAGAIIEVQPGGELLLDAAEIYNDCGDEWQGIRVISDGNTTGKVNYFRPSKILNARHKIFTGSEMNEKS